jgi:hypothetical protein
MKRRSFYLLVIWLPVILPVLLILLEDNTSLGKTHLRELLGSTLLIVGFSIVIAGVQYIVFAIGLIFFLRKKSNAFIACISWLLPILFLPVMFAGILLIFDGSLNSEDRWYWHSLAGITLGLGYFYVILAHALGFIFTKCKLIRD